MSLGKQYDYYRVIQILISTSIMEMQRYNDDSTDKIICSHQIYRALASTLPHIEQIVESSSDFNYSKLGTFTISDFVKLA